MTTRVCFFPDCERDAIPSLKYCAEHKRAAERWINEQGRLDMRDERRAAAFGPARAARRYELREVMREVLATEELIELLAEEYGLDSQPDGGEFAGGEMNGWDDRPSVNDVLDAIGWDDPDEIDLDGR